MMKYPRLAQRKTAIQLQSLINEGTDTEAGNCENAVSVTRRVCKEEKILDQDGRVIPRRGGGDTEDQLFFLQAVSS